MESVIVQLSKSGQLCQLKQNLECSSKEERKRVVFTKCNGETSLTTSCLNGHSDVVKFLVEYCGADLEQPDEFSYQEENIEGAPPLWCASAAGQLEIVKYLIDKGVNLNSTTKKQSSALKA